MASLQRRNTVSKSSGPSHMSSYALKGLPIRYKPPLFVPDILYLPATWKPPEMLSENSIGYDYGLENSILSHARMRALSVAAEESLKRQHLEEQQLQKEQQERAEAEAKAAREAAAAPSQPLLVFSSDILTPTPVVARSNTGSSSAENSSGDSESPKSSSEIELTTEPPIKALGQFSIREFEAIDDPFENASLQAINDMEVLQSVLQPIPPPIISTPTSPQPPSIATTQIFTTAQISTATNVGSTVPMANQSSPIPTPRTSKTQLQPKSETVFPGTTPPGLGNPFAPSSLPYPDPFLPNNSSNTATRGASPSEPGVGVLIDFGFDSTATQRPPTTVQQGPPTVTSAAATVRPLYSVQVDQPQGSPHPVPKPRTHLPPPTGPAYPRPGQISPPTGPPYPSSQTSPIIPPKGIRPPPPQSASVAPPPSLPPKPKGHVGFAIPSSSSSAVRPPPARGGVPVLPPPPARGGVPVLPPIPTTSSSVTTSSSGPPPNIPPPPYSSPPKNQRILPPYSSPPKTSPRGDPRTYKLPDPTSSLSPSQKSEVESLSHMGFPPPRVARALLRCEGDNTKILDFLFLVGQLEEQRFPGDSAETALIACKEDMTKALEYLKKVEAFKNIGFSEKKIHDAYKSSSQDWDKALDLLTEDR